MVEFPFLGTEDPAVEFANTAYGTGDNAVDYLGTADMIEQWFALALTDPGFSAQSPTVGRNAGKRVRALRDAIRVVISAAADGQVPDAAAVHVVNSAAAAAPSAVRLDWTSDSDPAARRLDTTSGSTAVLGYLATCCIALVTDQFRGIVLRCEGPDCSLLFVQQHRRRRYCHPSCAHRDRQARYYRRHRTGATP